MRSTYETIKKSWFHTFLLICFIAAIALLVVLDYFNLESIALFNERGFYFDYTWKGRLFLLFFLWLFVLESSLNLKQPEEDMETKPRSNLKLLAIFICALIPLVYVFSFNFLGLNQTVLNIGEMLRGDYWREVSPYWYLILEGDWPITVEYFVFAFSFLATTLLAYGKDGLKKFSITLGLVAGIGFIYLIDVMYPYGVFKPLQALALPTAACAAAMLDLLGYIFTMSYSPGPEAMPIIRARTVDGYSTSIGIAWPCAGVHSLFLYTLIILLLFKKSSMSSYRKLLYFIVGAVGTYLVNVFRILVYFFLRINDGLEAAQTFHDSYGELLFVVWVLLYILLIIAIQKFRLAEKTMNALEAVTRFSRKQKQQPTTHQQ